MLHKQFKTYLLIQNSAEISPSEFRSLLDYDMGQCAESSDLYFTILKVLQLKKRTLHTIVNSKTDKLVMRTANSGI